MLKRGFVLLTMSVLIPVTSRAQETSFRLRAEATAPQGQIRAAVSLYPVPVVEQDTLRKRYQDPARVQMTGKPRKTVIGWAIAIGVGAGLTSSAIAAAKYGENEGGQFCGRCFMEWSAVTVPVGAGAGALIGYLIDQSKK